MNMQPKVHTAYLGIRLSPDVKSKLDGEAGRMKVTATEIVRRALREYFKLRERRVRARL